jgi:hypothetical protein
MLLRKIIGIIIIVLNVAGLGFILYMAAIMLKNYFFSKKQTIAVKNRSTKKNRPDIANGDILTDEEDLLKDMDLSDIDTLNLDDFE